MTATQQRIALLLVLVAMVVGGGLWLQQDGEKNQVTQQQALRAEHLFACTQGADAKPMTWTTLAISQGNVTHTLTRAAQSDPNELPAPWQLTTPVLALADGEAVDALVQASCALTHVGVVPQKGPPLDRHLFGLAPPRMTLALTDSTGNTQTLLVGDKSNFDKTLFVSRGPDAAVERVDGAYRFQVERDTFAWREKRALPIAPESITALAVGHIRGPSYTITQTPQDGYLLTLPHGPDATVRADAGAVHELWQALTNLRAQDVMAESPDAQALARFGLHKPKVIARVHTAQGQDHVLRFGVLPIANQEHVFVQVGAPTAPVFRLPNAWALQKLSDGAQDLVDMRVMHLPDHAVRSVIVRQHGEALALQCQPATDGPDQWFFSKTSALHPGAALDHVLVGRNVDQLLHTRAARILTRHATAQDLTAAGLTVPQRTLELLAENDRPLSILWLGHSQNGETLLTDDHKQTIYAVFDSALAGFTLDPNAYMAAPAP